MKKMILMAAFALSVGLANAQISWMARVGANVSGIENADSQMKLGWKVGAGADYSFSKLFSVRSMLYYSTKGSTQGSSTMGFFPDEALKLGYLEMPVLGSFHFALGKNTSLAANVGPYIAYRITKSPSDTPIDYKKFDAGIDCGLDFGIKKFVIGVEAQYGIATLAKTAGDNLHNITYALTFGYKF